MTFTLTPKRQAIIQHLTHHGPQTAKQLTRHIPGPQKTTSTELSILTKHGYIQRIARGLYDAPTGDTPAPHQSNLTTAKTALAAHLTELAQSITHQPRHPDTHHTIHNINQTAQALQHIQQTH